MLITEAQHSGCHVHLKIMPIPHIPLLQNSSLGDQGSWIYYRLIFFLGVSSIGDVVSMHLYIHLKVSSTGKLSTLTCLKVFKFMVPVLVDLVFTCQISIRLTQW